MSRGWATVLLWGILLAILGLLHLVFSVRSIQLALALGAAAGVLALGTLLTLRPPSAGPRLVPELSYSTVTVAIGITMVAMGLVFGRWLWLIGAGVLVLGVGGVLREYLAARRSPR